MISAVKSLFFLSLRKLLTKHITKKNKETKKTILIAVLNSLNPVIPALTNGEHSIKKKHPVYVPCQDKYRSLLQAIPPKK